MRWTSREKNDPLLRLRRLVSHGKRWSSIYWRQVFAFDGREVNAAEIPLYMLQAVEQGRVARELIVRIMAERSAGRDPTQRRPYAELWDEAVTYVLGVRQDILRACAAAEFACTLAASGAWMDAFRAATIAYDIEETHAGAARYWHPFLYSFADVLVRLGHGRSYSHLRHLAQAAPRTSDPRPAGHRRHQR